jgi:uncharacterized repeat protein (TIGR01451 family)
MRLAIAWLLGGAIVGAALVSDAGVANAVGGSDVAVTAAWVGQGAPRAAVGQRATYSITVTNLGPDASTGTYLVPSNPDAFNLVSMTCSDASFCSPPGGALASGASVTATIIDVVCCFPAGADRLVAAGATVVVAPDTDPNLDNNTALVRTKITGPHGFSFP